MSPGHRGPHSSFPPTLLHYWLLTENQMDAFASHYHQTDPKDPYRHEYPACMNWDARFLARPPPNLAPEDNFYLSAEERLWVKRRMVGKFIGIRGCDTPIGEAKRRIRFYEQIMERGMAVERRAMSYKPGGVQMD
ncbi:hypothetical protein EJ06DRAFT_527493 [Trichodelitschia bisporula]|uniref:Uncharacterized protein n=1 Tax=Trichodelitschia bisporula TaxID=703511 RepID=A0A6G1I6T9_9PEZI|nr:hypothetical protein EJ06DRAFT_527493 [Trichodelitschia bisporula]